jgi:hypothetical protein
MQNKTSWFKQHWILTSVLAVVVLIIIIGILGGTSYDSSSSNTPSSNAPASNANSPNSSAPAPSSSNNPQPTTVTTIGTVYMLGKSWDADPEVDGLSFNLQPQDADGNNVDSAGTVSIKLWKMIEVSFENKCLKRSQDLLEEWNIIPISSNDYGFMGAEVKTEYKIYKPTSDQYAFGCAEITFTTSDGKNFTSLDDSIFINNAF